MIFERKNKKEKIKGRKEGEKAKLKKQLNTPCQRITNLTS